MIKNWVGIGKNSLFENSYSLLAVRYYYNKKVSSTMGQFYSNPDNLELAYKKYYRLIKAIVYQILKDDEDAKDVTHQSFLILCSYRDIQSMKLPSILLLLKEIARNQAIDFYRKAGTKQRFLKSAEGKLLQLLDIEFASEELLAEDVEKQRELMNKFIPKLPDRQKEVISLRYYNKKTALEISELLNISFHTVNNTLTAAKENLRKMIKEYRNPK